MRRSAVLVLAAIAASIGGCTLLIDFDEVDPVVAPEAGPSDDDGGPRDSAVVPDAPAVDGTPGFPPPCDPTFPLKDVKCNPSFPRPNCASNTTVFPSYPASYPRNGDLVTCNGSATPTCVQHCPFGCATMPEGYADQCDDCNGRPDGTYCVKDLRGADGRNLGLAVECKGGKMVRAPICGVNRCATKCPRSSPQPSCCI